MQIRCTSAPLSDYSILDPRQSLAGKVLFDPLVSAWKIEIWSTEFHARCRGRRPLHYNVKLQFVAQNKKPRPFGRGLCWHYLFSRQVTLQVSSAQMSLTSVFGMGTGGPSSQSIPTRMDGFKPSFMSKSQRILTAKKLYH